MQMGTPILLSLSNPKCFASALPQVINRIKSLSFEIRDLTRRFAAEDSLSAPVSRLKNAMYNTSRRNMSGWKDSPNLY